MRYSAVSGGVSEGAETFGAEFSGESDGSSVIGNASGFC
jgi:hypothetical protein